MSTAFRQRWMTAAFVAAMVVGLGVALPGLQGGGSGAQPTLRMEPGVRPGARDSSDGVAGDGGVVPDNLRRKFDPRTRTGFRVTSPRDASIFVLATGVKVLRPTGWKVLAEEQRGEIWRLKSGVPREVCVEQPPDETWKAYVRYGTEIEGLPLLRSQLREAWTIRSLSNWTGKAWGGGRFRGEHELASEETDSPPR